MASAAGMPCSLRLPGICNHNPATTVMCHLPGIGKSIASKVSDLHTAFGCSACHTAIDTLGWDRRGLSAAVVLDAILRGHAETQARLVVMGIIRVKGGKLV
ncbi:DUF1364 family protein [Pseudotabrizicola alkalilacus]|uniref:DUF1364 family protein n=2 Tax=Pseudotabrizicola alkalilacus TaxID=2305252 RepID=A0A411Z4K1_9RHOB|nr:DUF1364 family protein [Pseudotabrizicola alkalilacus]